MATEIVILSVHTEGNDSWETPHAHCPKHGSKIYAHDGRVNKITCDFCGSIIVYGGCSKCTGSVNHPFCDECGRDFCPNCAGRSRLGGYSPGGGLCASFLCKKCG